MKSVPVSLGGGCDVATELLQRHGLAQTTHFFDYLWNLDGGLKNVSRIIEQRFSGFDQIDQYVMRRHPEWNTPEVPGRLRIACADMDARQLVHSQYPDIAFIHYGQNEDLPRQFARKAERFLKLLSSGRAITFIYYRQYHAPVHGRYINGFDYDVEEKLDYFRTETEAFKSALSRQYPFLLFRLVSAFMEPDQPTPGVTEKVDRYFKSLEDSQGVFYRRVLRRRSQLSLQSWDELLTLLW